MSKPVEQDFWRIASNEIKGESTGLEKQRKGEVDKAQERRSKKFARHKMASRIKRYRIKRRRWIEKIEETIDIYSKMMDFKK